MNFKFPTLILLIFIITSCNKSKEADLRHQIQVLKEEKKALSKKVYELNNKTSRYEIRAEKKLNDQINISQFFINTFLESFNFKEQIFGTAMANSLPRKFDLTDSSDTEDYENWGKFYFNIYFYNNFSRDPENLKEVFSDDLIDLISNYFANNSNYKDARIYNVVKALLYAYDELEGYELMEDFYYELKNNDGMDYVEELSSEVVEDVLYCDYEEEDCFYSFDSFYVYSFWARRYHEGNEEVVYAILKKLHESISGETSLY